jgi:hypothetical protein
MPLTLQVDINTNNLIELHSEINQIKGYLLGVTQQSGTRSYEEAFARFDKVVDAVNTALSRNQILQ